MSAGWGWEIDAVKVCFVFHDQDLVKCCQDRILSVTWDWFPCYRQNTVLATFGNTQEIKRTLFNWMKQDFVQLKSVLSIFCLFQIFFRMLAVNSVSDFFFFFFLNGKSTSVTVVHRQRETVTLRLSARWGVACIDERPFWAQLAERFAQIDFFSTHTFVYLQETESVSKK